MCGIGTIEETTTTKVDVGCGLDIVDGELASERVGVPVPAMRRATRGLVRALPATIR
jgi:hypothetical protein